MSRINITKYYVGRFFDLFHRALAALAAAWRRCSAVMVCSRRLPPTFPPLLPIFAMY
jgi:hypothetical protein